MTGQISVVFLYFHFFTLQISTALELTRSELLQHLMANYSNKTPPNFDNDDPIEVKVGIYINSFDSINESTMDYAMSIFLRQSWVDHRLAYENLSRESVLTLDSRSLYDVWVPDLFFNNEKDGHFHHITVPNTYIRIYPNGNISYSARLSLEFSCPMRLQKYPMDVQVCSMTLETYAYSIEQLRFEWHGDSAVELNTDLELNQFRLKDISLHNYIKRYSTGSFSGLEARFHLQRDLGFYMIQTYIPSMLIVVLSWVSFWLSYDAVPARISLGVLTVLTMTTMTSGMSRQLPRVSYVKAMDVWLSTCQFFVFAALVEFAFVNWLTRREQKQRKNMARRSLSGNSSQTAASHDYLLTKPSLKKQDSLRHPHNGFQRTSYMTGAKRTQAERLDHFAQPLFPLAFLLFNLVYWAFYCNWDNQS